MPPVDGSSGQARARQGTTRYKCSWESCSKAFTRRSALVDHIRGIHDREKPFTCEVCQKAFVRRNDWARHQKLQHSEEKTHVCGSCGKSFARPDALLEHFRSKKGQRCLQSSSRTTSHPPGVKSPPLATQMDELHEPTGIGEAQSSRRPPVDPNHRQDATSTIATGIINVESHLNKDKPAIATDNTAPFGDNVGQVLRAADFVPSSLSITQMTHPVSPFGSFHPYVLNASEDSPQVRLQRQPKTISPKDAVLDYVDHMDGSPLFPELPPETERRQPPSYSTTARAPPIYNPISRPSTNIESAQNALQIGVSQPSHPLPSVGHQQDEGHSAHVGLSILSEVAQERERTSATHTKPNGNHQPHYVTEASTPTYVHQFERCLTRVHDLKRKLDFWEMAREPPYSGPWVQHILIAVTSRSSHSRLPIPHCLACWRDFDSYEKLEHHVYAHEEDLKIPRFRCWHCDRRFGLESMLLAHLHDIDYKSSTHTVLFKEGINRQWDILPLRLVWDLTGMRRRDETAWVSFIAEYVVATAKAYAAYIRTCSPGP
jgi:Zinc finger, C2H2 type